MEFQSSSPENLQFNIGCAGWSIPKEFDSHFPCEGSHLERYSRVFNAVEINSSFYRPHKPDTYERWGNSVPDTFSFAVKVPKLITHSLKLKSTNEELATFLGECTNLGEKLGVLLVQLPPSLSFNASIATAFFETLRAQFEGDVALEPRHATWFTPEVDKLLWNHHIARVAADPAPVPQAAHPGGWNKLQYHRLHGSPRIYYSDYSNEYLAKLAQTLTQAIAAGSRIWCIFDNTAEGAATGNALTLTESLANRK